MVLVILCVVVCVCVYTPPFSSREAGNSLVRGFIVVCERVVVCTHTHTHTETASQFRNCKGLRFLSSLSAIHLGVLVVVQLKLQSMSATTTNGANLAQLRALLREQGIDAFVVESGDRHQSEYIHESDMRRQFISGFTGSAGTAVILQDRAYLWTDGRYFLQAEKQLSEEWTLMKSLMPGVPEPDDFLPTILAPGTVVGADPFLINTKKAKQYTMKLGAKGIEFRGVPVNPVDAVWGTHKPAPPQGQVRVHGMQHAGVAHTDKIARVQAVIAQQKAWGLVISTLDEVRSWQVRFHIVIILWPD
jgi:hypothetical protein